MTATCTYPACDVSLRYLRNGKIFTLEAKHVDLGSGTDPGKRRIEYFWLRGECAPGHARDANDGRSSLYLPTFHDLLSRLWLPRNASAPRSDGPWR
jgi:hypothetical protein